MPAPALHLFDAFGIELEYMIVDARTGNVRPLCDRLIAAACGSPESEIERPDNVSWSNELVNHVVELKTTEPVSAVASAQAPLATSVREINAMLGPLGARLMPGGMHPWMNAARETELWAHEYGDVYRNFDRLFNCRRHGWANLQSVHLNLPFAIEDVESPIGEFARLHAAVRLILPLLPALCASSPIVDGHATGLLCNRMDVYRANQSKVPSLTGQVIPEPCFTRTDYQRVIMDPIARDVARLDPSGLMQPEWMNSRGAIARFDRGSIEIRVMDVQEHPAADLAIIAGLVRVLRWLVSEGPSTIDEQKQESTGHLCAVLDRTIVDAEGALIEDPDYLELLGCSHQRTTAADLWRHLFSAAGVPLDREEFAPLKFILDRGPLSRRMLGRLGNPRGDVDRAALHSIAAELCDCLISGSAFDAAG